VVPTNSDLASARPIRRLLGRIESRALLLFLAVAGAIWGFLNVADEVTEGETHSIDRALLLSMRNPADPNDPVGSRSFEEAVRDITALGGFTVLTIVTVVGALAFVFHKKPRHAGILIFTVLAAQLTSELLKEVYGRARPDLVSHGSYVYSGSFPSGHSMLSAATYLTLAVLVSSLEPRRRTKMLVFAIAVLTMLAVGVSRVYLGVHWPTDVLGGWCGGVAWAALAWMALQRLVGRPRDAG
jgi:undecaprenyl-diphosphatase